MKRATGMAGPLVAMDHQVAVCGWDAPANNARMALECPSAELLLIPPCGALAEGRRKRRLLRQWRPDLVYVCAFGVRNFVCRGQAGRHARVLVEHSEMPSAIPQPLPRRLWERCCEQLSLFVCNGLVCASRYLETVYRTRAAACRRNLPVTYLPYAFNPAMLQPDRCKSARFHALAGGRKSILYMGTLAANYGILDLIAAARELLRRRGDFVLHVIGRGRHEAQARAAAVKAQMNDHILFHGFVAEEDIASWFAVADVFVAPLHDTIQDRARCPSKVYMYLPFKKPIVTSPLGDPRDLLGEDGFYCPPGDMKGMAAAISGALDASPTWVPRHVKAEEHTWEYRTRQFLDWVTQTGLA